MLAVSSSAQHHIFLGVLSLARWRGQAPAPHPQVSAASTRLSYSELVTAAEAYDLTTRGGAGDFAQVIAACETFAPYCLIGGLAVNCYVEPLYTLDADIVAVASLEDVVPGKLWAYDDRQRLLSKRKKDELDLIRLAEAHPQLTSLYPKELLEQLKGA